MKNSKEGYSNETKAKAKIITLDGKGSKIAALFKLADENNQVKRFPGDSSSTDSQSNANNNNS